MNCKCGWKGVASITSDVIVGTYLQRCPSCGEDQEMVVCSVEEYKRLSKNSWNWMKVQHAGIKKVDCKGNLFLGGV
jgi:hypothetical protein